MDFRTSLKAIWCLFLQISPFVNAAFSNRPTFHNRQLFRWNLRTQVAENDDQGSGDEFSSQRRSLFKTIALLPAQMAALSLNKEIIPDAQARGLVRFPCKDFQFLNTYHFLRAGESLLEEEGVWVTNPLFLTNQESALSQKGIDQIEETCKRLKEAEVNPTIVRYSLAANSIGTSDIVGKDLKIGRNNIVPEFNYMDPRAIGKWDMLPLATTQSAVWSMDAKEAGSDGIYGRPPANEDSTPHETLADQVVRLQQLISVLETQYSGDTILLIFPDGTGPALLTCLIGGIPLNRVHEFEYKNGEVRLNINYDTAHEYLSSTPSEAYLNILESGEEELKVLRTNPNAILNVREQQYQEELRLEREGIEKANMIKREQDLLEKQKKDKEMKKRDETKSITSSKSEDGSSNNLLSIVGLTSVGAIGAFSLLGSEPEESDENENDDMNTVLSTSNDEVKKATLPILDINKPISISLPPIEKISNNSTSVVEEDEPITNNNLQKAKVSTWDPNEDDGGEAWLGALSEIMNDEEETTPADESSWQ